MKGKKPAPTNPSPKTAPRPSGKKVAAAASTPSPAKRKTSSRKERPVPRTLAGMGREVPAPKPEAPPPNDLPLEDTVVIDIFSPPREDFLTGGRPLYLK